MEKKEKEKKKAFNKDGSAKVGSERFPFEVDDLDHCETPYEAYKDISLFLELYAKLIGKTKATLSIYDPYFCDGSIKKHFASLGYHNVYNVKEDFYKRIKNNSTPSFDVLITNPPYSSDHIEKLIKFVKDKTVKEKGKPFFSSFAKLRVHKAFYKAHMEGVNVLYYVPIKFRYYYTPPTWVDKNDGSSALSKGKKSTSPFHSFWYIYGGSNALNKKFIEKYFNSIRGSISGEQNYGNRIDMLKQRIALCQSVQDIPYEYRGELDTQKKKRPNPKARKRLRETLKSSSTGHQASNKKDFRTMYMNAKKKKKSHEEKKKVFNFI